MMKTRRNHRNSTKDFGNEKNETKRGSGEETKREMFDLHLDRSSSRGPPPLFPGLPPRPHPAGPRPSRTAPTQTAPTQTARTQTARTQTTSTWVAPTCSGPRTARIWTASEPHANLVEHGRAHELDGKGFFSDCRARKGFCEITPRDFQGLRMELEDDPDGEVLTLDEWRQLCVEMDRLEGAMEEYTESSSSTCDESYADNECMGTDINGETLYQEPSKKKAWTVHTRVCRWTASAFRRYDGSLSPRHRSRPLETGCKLSMSLKTRTIARTAAMTAMGMKRMMRGAQCHALLASLRPRRKGRTSTGIVLSEQLDFPSLRREASCLWLANLARRRKGYDPRRSGENYASVLCLSTIVSLCCWSDGSVLSRFLLRNHCRVQTFSVSPKCIFNDVCVA